MLLAGPPGLGKTSLARIVAAELGVPFVQTAGPALERKGDIAAFLTELEPREVFFVDEIHRLPRAVEETFYPAMEDRQLPITLGRAGRARSSRSTCRRSRSSARRRAPGCSRRRCATASGSSTGSTTTARRARADRRAQRRRARRGDRRGRRAGDRRRARAARRASRTGCSSACATTPRCAATARSTRRSRAPRSTCWASTQLGLDRLDREILAAICERFAGGPVGLSTLAVAVHEEADTIEDVYEPYLLQRGFLQRTPRGRCATAHAYRHLGLEPPAEPSALF